MMVHDDIEKLCAEISKKHKVVFSIDDPYAIAVSVNRALIQDLATAISEITKDFKEITATSIHDWESRSNIRAEKIINASIASAKNAIANGAELGSQAVVGTLTQTIGTAALQLQRHLQEAKYLFKYQIITTLLSLISLISVFVIIYLRF